MSKSSENIKCWYKISNNKIKISSDAASEHDFRTQMCTKCKFSIVSTTYQQPDCGSRYCQSCYDELDYKFYCDVCQSDKRDDFIHKKESIFLDKALKRDMEKETVKCPDCKVSTKLFNLEAHVNNCSEGWIHCSSCNSMVKKKLKHKCEGQISSLKATNSEYEICSSCGKQCSNLKEHLSECTINWTVNCPYGCKIEENSNLHIHREKEHLFHLDKAWAIMQRHNLTECKEEDSLKFVSIMDSVIDNVKKSLGIEVSKVDDLVKDMKSLNETIGDEISIYESIKSTLKSQISDSLLTSFDGTILWRIDNFSEVKSKAKDESQKSIFSPPFYTSRFGYKMCLRLYPNGDSTAKGVAMSLFLVIMKGNYDSLLTWPFKQKVTFILLDQDFKTNMIDAFVPCDNLTSFARPRTDMNIPSGSSYFIKFEDMNLHKYVKDNTIFIRCIIDCSDLHE
uniref:TNF receptor-associated factor 2 n=1 Tax=Dugesia japonica TaxID=6161 RepID=A0A2U8JGG0_DUGJA|nr:TNF receptor-associated factor 2 [Dugesia japonica]